MPTSDTVRSALESVTDPDHGSDVCSTGVVDEVTVDGRTVTLSVELTGIAPAMAEDLVEAMRSTVMSIPGVEQVRVDDGGPTVADSQSVGLSADRVVAVASAKGGVGKSTVATALARTLTDRGEEVGVFDADIYGPNIPELVDAQGPVEATAGGQAAPIEAGGLSVMSIGLLDNDAPIAWRGAMAHEALLDLLEDTAWGSLDTLVLDLPPGTGDIVLTTLQDVPVDGVVLVTTPYPTAVDDTGRSATLFRENGVPILGAVVNMAGFTCPTCGDDHDLFGPSDVDLDVPILADLPFDGSLDDLGDTVPEPVEALATRVDERLEDSGFEMPANPLDVSGLPPAIRVELVTDEFAALDPDECLHVVTDRPPEALLAAVGGDPAGPATRHSHDGCACGHDHDAGVNDPVDDSFGEGGLGDGSLDEATLVDGSLGEDSSGDRIPLSDEVGSVDVQRIGVESWAFRVEKAAVS